MRVLKVSVYLQAMKNIFYTIIIKGPQVQYNTEVHIMQITDIKVRKLFNEGPMKAIVSVTFDGQLAVHDIKVIYARDKFFIVMPSRKNPDETYRDIVHPINAQFRGVLESAVVEAYEAALAQQEAEQAQAAAEAKEAEDPATV